MSMRMGRIFWVELIAGATSAVMLAVTLVWPQWIETILDVDPDGGSGETEWELTVGLCIVTVVMFIAAHREWRRGMVARSIG